MIKLNTEMRSLATSAYESPASLKCIWVFSGTPPTKAQIDALITSKGVIMSNTLKALGTLRLSAVFTTAVVPTMLNANLQRWELGKLGVEFTVHTPGEAQWFVFMLAQTNLNSPAFTTNSEVYQAYIGTAGDIGDDVDMELLTGIIESDKLYKTTDFDVRLV